MPGGKVCFSHGGNSAHARRKAIERLLMLSEPALYFLREVIMDPARDDDTKMKAVKLTLDRVVPATMNIDATMTHKVPGWEAVINGMFEAQQEPAAIEAAGPSLSDLTDAYNERGFIYQEARRRHAARVLGREVMTSQELSASDIRTLLADLQPYNAVSEVIDAEVLPEEPAPGARVSRARSEQPVRVESGDERLPDYLASRPRRFY